MKASDIDVVILCGGLGTRLNSVLPNRPKALAPVGGRAFLDILIQELQRHGFKRFILCVGFLNEQIVEYDNALTERVDGVKDFEEPKERAS